MKLYYMPGACSLTIHIALIKSGLPHETQALKHEELKTPEYLALNPLGSVPCLVDGDFSLTQNVAILTYLDALRPEARLFGGDDPKTRADVMRWLVFCNSDLHPSFKPLFAPGRLLDDEKSHPALQAKARQTVADLLAVADAAVGDKNGFVAAPSVADIYMFVILRWCRGLKIDIPPHLAALFEHLSADPDVQRALKEEGLTH